MSWWKAMAVLLLAVAAIAVGLAAWHVVRFAGTSYGLDEPVANIGLERLAIGKTAHEPVRIVVAGTSLTNRGIWPEQLAQDLQVCRPGKVSVERAARSGANSDWGLAAVRHVLAGSPVDLLVVEFSINDASLIHGLPLARSAANLDAMLALARAAGVPVLLATMSPAWGQKALERPGQVGYRNLYRARAGSGAAALVDTIGVWQGLARDLRRELVPDGLHPSPDGMARIQVPAMAAVLRPLLCPDG